MRAVIRLLLIVGLLLSASSLAPLASADPTGSPSPAAGASATKTATRGSSSPSGSPSGQHSASRNSLAAAVPQDSSLHTRITSHTTTSGRRLVSLKPTTLGKATFRYSANKPYVTGGPNVKFQCKLNGPGQSGTWDQNCPMNTVPSATTTGERTYQGLHAKPQAYTFTVQAYRPAASPPNTHQSDGSVATFSWYIYSLLVRDHYTPRLGAHYNNPLGNRTHVRTNLTHVVRTINSMPGYREPATGGAPCRSTFLSRVRISLYSMTDQFVAKALVLAARRCVSVQILMNNHLNSSNDPAWHTVEAALRPSVYTRVNGRRVGRPNFAHRCSFGCQGSGVLHTKMYLFDSNVPAPNGSWNKITKTVITGSSNMTFNAAKVQWNDLYTVPHNARLFSVFQNQFMRMKRDNGFHRTRGPVNGGGYQTTFWPTRASDPERAAVGSIHCHGANGGTGIGGRSLVYINMHAWFGSRGLAFAHQVRGLYTHGCYVRILYSFMSFGVFKILHKGTGARMVVRRTVFSHNGKTAYLYSHYKNISVSGYVGGDHSNHVVWTGSNNFTNDGTHFDEDMIKITSGRAYAQYRNEWNFMRRRKSSAVYANFSEPHGGGRAPRATPAPRGGLPRSWRPRRGSYDPSRRP